MLVLLYILFLSLCAFLVPAGKEYEVHSNFYRFLLDSATWLGLHLLRIRVHVTGLEKVPTDAKLLFVSNHRSKFDPIVTWSVFRKWKIAFISKPENFSVPVFGRIIRKCCFLAIDRENPRNAMLTIRKAASLLEKQEVSVGVYPEGTRSKQGQLLPFHNGVFKIAQKADAPMVVLRITGTEQIARRTPFRSTDVYLDVLEVLPAEQLRTAQTAAIGAEVRRLIETQTERENEHGNRICFV